jgi:5-dehydro-4-deoxyglucarate dehydratase
MKPQELKAKLTGVIAFAPTPFTADDRVDYDGLAKQIDFLAQHADVVVTCGGVAEFYALELDEYQRCISTAAEAMAGRKPLLAGIGHSTKIACHLAEHAASAGVDGLMINPLYFIEAPEAGMRRHYGELAQVGLGMMMFSTKGAVYSPSMAERLAEIEEVVALKDEWGDLRLFTETKDRLGDRLAWVNGMAEIMAAPYFAAGAVAFTSGIVNFAPEVVRSVWDAGAAGDFATLNEIVAAKIRPVAKLRQRAPGHHITVVKEAMNLLGLPGGEVRSPLVPLSECDRADVRRALVDLDLLPA